MLQPLFIYSDYLTTATVTATDTKSGLSPLDVLAAEEDNVWQPLNVTGSKSLTIDLGMAQAMGALGIVGDYLAGVTLELRASSDNFATSDVQISSPSVMSDYITHYRLWANTSYRYWRLIFTGLGASTAVAHVALCSQDLLPFMDDGMDPDAYASVGTALISPDGRFLGASRLRTMREIVAKWGQIDDSEYVLFQRWADASLKNIRPFFFVLDSSQAECHFAWCDPKQKFTAPYSNGLRNVGSITMTARMV